MGRDPVWYGRLLSFRRKVLSLSIFSTINMDATNMFHNTRSYIQVGVIFMQTVIYYIRPDFYW
jgi:hypothetical protein